MDEASNPAREIEPEDREQTLAPARTWGGFELLELVGRGSFGEVYRAWDPRLQREIALKLLLPRSMGDETQFEALLREARALASVRHPNIVSIYGVDRRDGLVGFWTDFVQGKTLARLVREQGPFGYRETALIGLDVAKALSSVHRTGLLHRDIKAENVMREEGGRILLMDFGLSTLPQLQNELAGSPRYMAPELFTGAPASVASDIYAVGLLLFYLVAGQFPAEPAGTGSKGHEELSGDEPTATATQLPGSKRGTSGLLAMASRSLLDYRPDLPESFARVVDTAIHADPAKRFASAGALSAALSEVLGSPLAGDASAPAKPAKAKRRPAWQTVALAAAVVILAAGAFAYLRYRSALPGTAQGQAASAGVNDEYLKADGILLRYDKRKNVTDAIALLNDVLKQDPSFALAQAGLCRADFLQYRVTRTAGLMGEARAACNRASAIDPNLAPPYISLARIDAMAGNTALATTEVEKALQLDPRSAEAYGAQSEVFEAEGRSADAIATVQKAIDLAPDDWRWQVALGNYFYSGGKLEEAAEQYRKAVELTPDNATALLDLGLAFLQLGRYDDALSNLQKSADIQPGFFAYSSLSEVLTAQGKFSDAVEMSKKARDLNPTNYVAWGNLASAYLWSPGGHDQAMDAYQKAIELGEVARKETPADAQLLENLGGYYAETGRPDRSLPLLRQAIALAPNNPSVLFGAGDGYEVMHHRDEAIHLIARSLALGYHADQLERSPELASLRADPNFEGALKSEQAKLSLDTAGKRH
ncbi:MAG: protein kinase domain-containing protein [Terracidiphilus sp.]